MSAPRHPLEPFGGLQIDKIVAKALELKAKYLKGKAMGTVTDPEDCGFLMNAAVALAKHLHQLAEHHEQQQAAIE